MRGDSWLKFQFARSKLPYFYFALVLACVAWFVTSVAGRSRMGLLVARGEGQSGSSPEPRRGRVQLQDGCGRGLRLPGRRSAAASMRSLSPISILKASWAFSSRC